MKRLALPPCGKCDLTAPIAGVKDTLYCHGGPPGVLNEIVAITVPGSNEVQQQKRTSSQYPPVGIDKPGCALHPLLRKKIFGGRV